MDRSPRKISPEQVARRLVALREAVALGPSEFADTVGIDRSSYSKIEAGKKALRSEMGFAIAERWGVSMDFLYRGVLSDLPEKYRTNILSHLSQGQE